jgi:hypothetical protein
MHYTAHSTFSASLESTCEEHTRQVPKSIIGHPDRGEGEGEGKAAMPHSRKAVQKNQFHWLQVIVRPGSDCAGRG